MVHARITVSKWQMKYLRAMTCEWLGTIRVGEPIRKWLEKAHELREMYSADNDGGGGRT